ncbi:NAD-P-binding protein [Trametes cingulata]|nr:NAD-P-binding protein [Trametes cingulata]
MPSYAVVGASRGIGLEFVHQLAKKPNTTVYAVVRNVASSLLEPVVAEHKNVHVIQGDVVDHRSMTRAAEAVFALSGGVLDVLIHNAARLDGAKIFRGYDDYTDLDELDEDLIDAFKVNTLGIIHGVSAFLPLLRRGTTKKIIILSTVGASPKYTVAWGAATGVAYSITKASGVMVAAKYAAGLKHEGFLVVSIHPGVVDTSGTAPEAGEWRDVAKAMTEAGLPAELLTPVRSVEAQLRLIDRLTPESNGALLSYTGEEIA